MALSRARKPDSSSSPRVEDEEPRSERSEAAAGRSPASALPAFLRSSIEVEHASQSEGVPLCPRSYPSAPHESGEHQQSSGNVLPLFLKRENDGSSTSKMSAEPPEIVDANDPSEHEAEALADQVAGTATAAGPHSGATTTSSVPQAPPSSDIGGTFGSALGSNLAGVRVHTGAQAAAMSRTLNAHAFTHGRDIYFGQGKFAPNTQWGAHLLAHELVHASRHAPARGVIRRRRADDPVPNTPATGLEGVGNTTERQRGEEAFDFSEAEMASRLAATPAAVPASGAARTQSEPSTESRLAGVDSGRTAPRAAAGGARERSDATPARSRRRQGSDAGQEASRDARSSARTARTGTQGTAGGGGSSGGPAPTTPGPSQEFEGMVADDVAAYLDGHLSGERLAQLDPRTRELLEAADTLGERLITDPEGRALEHANRPGAAPGAPRTGYENEPLWLRTLASVRDISGQLGGIVGIIGLAATVSGFILSLLVPPVGAFLLTVGRFCDVAALILDAISLILGIVLTGYNRYRLKNATDPEERRRLLGMVRQDALGTVMSGIALATAIAPGAGRLLGRGGRRISSGLRTLSRSTSMAGRTARQVRRMAAYGRLGVRGARRQLRAASQQVSTSLRTGFRTLSQSSSLLGRTARQVRIAGVLGRRAAGSIGRRTTARLQEALIHARGTTAVRWTNRLGGQAEDWARRRLRGLATNDSWLGHFYNRRIRGFHERNVMVARSINDPIERAYQQRLGQQLNAELTTMLSNAPPPARAAGTTAAQYQQVLESHAQGIDDALRQRFGRERYGHAQVGVERGRVRFVRDDSAFLGEIRAAEFAEIQLLRQRHPGANPRELAELVNGNPFIRGRWTPEEVAAFTRLQPNVRSASGEVLTGQVSKTGHHTIPASHAPQIAEDARFIQIVNDTRFYRDFIDDAFPGVTHMPDPRSVRVPGARAGRTRQATNLQEALQGMVDRGDFAGFSGANPADRLYFSSQRFVDDLIAQGSTGVWVNPRNSAQRFFFNPHLVIGHNWRWRNAIARPIFDMNSRLGLRLSGELATQLLAPALHRSGHLLGPTLFQPSIPMLDRVLSVGRTARDTQLDRSRAHLPVSSATVDEAGPSAADSSLGLLPPSLAAFRVAGPLAGPTPMPDSGALQAHDAPVEGESASRGPDRDASAWPETPESPVPFSPSSLVSIREQRGLVAESIGALDQYIGDARSAEGHNRMAQEAAEDLQARSGEQRQTAQTQREIIVGEQENLSSAEAAQQNMASETARGTGESRRGQGQAETVQSEGQGVNVEAKPEEPQSRSWLERAWDATGGAAWRRLVAPAIRLVRRKVNDVMQSINNFIMRMINQVLGLDEIEAELNGGGQDIQNRRGNLSATDTGLRETQAQASEEEQRNQLSAQQAGQNVEDAQATRGDAQTMRASLLEHQQLLQAEEATGREYVTGFGGRYRAYFEQQRQLPQEQDDADASEPVHASVDLTAGAEPSPEREATDDTAVT